MKRLSWLILLFSFSANARVITESFTSTTYKDSSTLIWNTELGRLHPSPLIYNYGSGGTSQTTFSVGDGSDGAFEPGTYEQFGTVVGNHITVDASNDRILKVTRFHLDATHTLSASGGPLVIHSLSTVIIDGSITCGGDNGGDAATGGAGGSGGNGRCGGYAGGDGGASATTGLIAQPTSGNVTGGEGGIHSNPVFGTGGGGGGSRYNPAPGEPGKGVNPALGGDGGLSFDDQEFTDLEGSGGGGGGGGSTTEAGGGGGAGGGTVIIQAVSHVVIRTGGSIIATGGDGGSATSGGGGGGGGGGNIKILTPGTVEVQVGAEVKSTNGVGGSSSGQVSPDGSGGDGAFGRTWLGSSTTSIFGSVPDTAFFGDAQAGFVSGTVQTATSKSFDTGTKLVTYQSVTTDSVNSDITLQVAGSDDNFASDDSGWINVAAISGLAKKRYLKFRVNINNSDHLNPTVVNEVNITFDPGIQENFSFKSSGCGLVKNPPNNSSPWFILLLFAPLLLAWRLRKPKTVRVRVRK